MRERVAARWWSRRALCAHLALACWVPGCLAAAWWQVTVAMGGNGLAYLYAVEWPVFALFGVVWWWNFVHDEPAAVGRRRLLVLRRSAAAVAGAPPARPAYRSESEDPELAAYNDYLEQLARRSRAKTWRG